MMVFGTERDVQFARHSKRESVIAKVAPLCTNAGNVVRAITAIRIAQKNSDENAPLVDQKINK